MGQEANPKFDYYELAKYDAKISNFEDFIKEFYIYLKNNNILFKSKINFLRNMAPQYGIEVCTLDKNEVFGLANNLSDFVSYIGLKSKIDVNEFNITLTIDIAADNQFQKRYTLKDAEKKYNKYGFTFTRIEDHHSGSHCPQGTFAILGSNKSLEKTVNNNIDINKELDYLKISKIIIEALK